MRIEAIATHSYVGPERCLTGASAALAEARRMFLASSPTVPWSEVTARAAQVRAREPMTLVQAIQVVCDQLARGK